MAQKLEELMEQERSKLAARRDELTKELAEVDHQIARIDAYFNAGTPKKPAAAGTRAPRGSVQTSIIELLSGTDGLTPAEIHAKLSERGVDVPKQSIANALSNGVKAGKLRAPDARGGKYVAV